MAPVSNTRIGVGPLRSTSAGIFEFGLILTKPLPNWSPSPILISQASYSAPLWPFASSSSSMIVTLTPFGVPSEYSWIGCLPTGSSLSCVAPDTGRLMLAKRPPLGLFQTQTLGGVYSVVSAIPEAPLLRKSTDLTRQAATPVLFRRARAAGGRGPSPDVAGRSSLAARPFRDRVAARRHRSSHTSSMRLPL